MGLVRAAARVAKGWRQEQVQAGRPAGRGRAERDRRPVRPAAPGRLPGRGPPAGAVDHDAGRHDRPVRRGHRLRRPHRHQRTRPRTAATRAASTRASSGGRASCAPCGTGRRSTASTWPTAMPAATASSTCRCSRASARRTPSIPTRRLTLVATARRWPVEHWDRPPGVPSVVGLEPYHMLRPFVRTAVLPLRALRHRRGRARAAAWAGAVGRQPPQLLRRGGAGPRGARHRSPGALPRQEGDLRRAGRRDRSPGPSAASRSTAAAGPVSRCGRPSPPCKAGEVVIVLPQGTIPRGYDFFDPVLHGKTGTARLAASTGATVVPVGLWGTEKVWPRSARVPDFTLVRHPPKVTVRVGRAGPALAHRRQGGHRGHHGGHQRAAAPESRGCVTSRPPRSWRAASLLGEERRLASATTTRRSTPRRVVSAGARARWPAAGPASGSTRSCSST